MIKSGLFFKVKLLQIYTVSSCSYRLVSVQDCSEENNLSSKHPESLILSTRMPRFSLLFQATVFSFNLYTIMKQTERDMIKN